MRRLGLIAAFLTVGYHMLYVAGVFPSFGFQVLPFAHRSISLGSILFLAYLFYPVRRGGRTHTVSGLLLGSVSFYLATYPVRNLEAVRRSQFLGSASLEEQIYVLLLVVLLLEASRRVLGLALPIFVGLGALHPLVMDRLPGILNAPGQSQSRIASTYFFSSDGLLGVVLQIASTIIIMFVIFGLLLQLTGGTKFFIDLALSLVGRLRGGPAKVAVVASALMGSISGSSAANAATTGTITIPMMKRTGYSSSYSAAVESVASNGGQLLPPIMGVVAFLVAEFLGMSYVAVMAAGITPAIIYYLALLAQVDMRAALDGLGAVDEALAPRLSDVLREGWHHLISIGVLIYAIAGLRLSPERSAAYAIVVVLIVSSLRPQTRIRLGDLKKFGESFPSAFLPAGVATAAAGIIMASLGLTGFGLRFSSGFVTAAGGRLWLLLLLAALASFVMGMGMSSVPVYVILAATVAPNLVALGIEPIAAHMFVFWWGVTSFITPPICITVYVAASIAGASPIRAGFTAARLGIANYLIPFVFVLEPALLLVDGLNLPYGIAAGSALLGTIFFAAGLEGYLAVPLRPWSRVVLAACGLLLLFPGALGDMVGLAVGVIVFAILRAAKAAPVTETVNQTQA